MIGGGFGGATVARTLKVLEPKLTVTVVDNGRGMDGSETVAGFGIIGMRERAASLGGSLLVKNRADRGGVILTAQFPLNEAVRVVTTAKVPEFSP